MHIELTDLLRCPKEHEESFLVLLPGKMAGRRVMTGELGCPVCQWATVWQDGVPDFGGGEAAPGEPPCDAEALLALLGLEGAGGWLALAGTMAALAPAVAALLPGVGIIAINPIPAILPADGVQLLKSASWPIKQHALRGLAIGSGAEAWADQAVGSVLPGLRAVGSGTPPPAGVRGELLAEAGGLWVVRCK